MPSLPSALFYTLPSLLFFLLSPINGNRIRARRTTKGKKGTKVKVTDARVKSTEER